MLEAICSHAMDILAGDPRTIRKGNAWGTAWPGVKRIHGGDSAAEGYVNLFDGPLEIDSRDARDAIYCGLPGMDVTADDEQFPAISSVRVSFRVAKIPLVIMALGTTRNEARRKANQLRANVMYTFLDRQYLVQDGYWYEVSIPGNQAGGDARLRAFLSSTGGGQRGVNEAGRVLTLTVKYSMCEGGDTA